MLSDLLIRLRFLFRRAAVENELDAELRFHFDQQVHKLENAGFSAQESRRRARLTIGGTDAIKEQCRDARGTHILDSLTQDIRYAIRGLRKNSGFAAAAILTLALGMGANTAIFSVANAFVFRPLPVRGANRLMVITSQSGKTDDPGPLSYADFLDYKSQTNSFREITGFHSDLAALSSESRSSRVVACFVPSNYFSMLGLNSSLGRLIARGEGDQPSTGPVVVLGYKYWQQNFLSDPNVTERKVTLNGKPVTIIGVAPKGFQGTYAVIEMDIYAPIGMLGPDAASFFTNRDNRDFRVIGVLNPNISIPQAQSEFAVVAQRLAAQFPETNRDQIVRIFPEKTARPDPSEAGRAALVATIFLVLVALVLLVACVNVAGLLLARATSRQKELAVRVALGAGRWRIVRQILTESVILAILGAVGGAFAGMWVCKYLGTLRPLGAFALGFSFTMDWRVFAYVAIASLFAGVVAGLAPALRATRLNAIEALQEGFRGNSGAGAKHRARNTLVVAQLSVSIVILVAASLFTQNMVHAQHIDLGFDPKNVLDVALDSALLGYSREKSELFFLSLLNRARALPGVVSASTAFTVPMNYYNDSTPIYAEGRRIPPDQRPAEAGVNPISTGYFTTMRTHILKGRDFTDADTQSHEAVAIISETMAQRMWPQQDPLDRKFSYKSAAGPFVRVVGVSQDTKVYGPAAKPTMYFYLPQSQFYKAVHVLQLRTSIPPSALIPSVEALVRELDPNVPMFDVMPLEKTVNGVGGFFAYRAGAAFAGALGVIGLMLALVGMYGVVSYTTKLRTHELGIRVALGARRRDVLALILASSARLVAMGIALGVIAALAVARLLAGVISGINSYDPVTFAGVAALLAAVAMTACFIPARRASCVNPIIALRHE